MESVPNYSYNTFFNAKERSNASFKKTKLTANKDQKNARLKVSLDNAYEALSLYHETLTRIGEENFIADAKQLVTDFLPIKEIDVLNPIKSEIGRALWLKNNSWIMYFLLILSLIGMAYCIISDTPYFSLIFFTAFVSFTAFKLIYLYFKVDRFIIKEFVSNELESLWIKSRQIHQLNHNCVRS